MNIVLIPDSEIDLIESEDLLGTKPYAQTLYELVTSCKTPTNIGLLGGWGSGKSSIIKTFKHLLEKDNKEIKVFTYDAWKYSNDDFRRSLLNELKNEFELTADIDELIYNEKENESETINRSFNRYKWVDFTLGTALIIFIIAFLYGIWQTDYDIWTKSIFAGLGVIVTVISMLLKNIFVSTKITLKRNKIIEPERFEDLFWDMINIILVQDQSKLKLIKNFTFKEKKYNISKIVIVIDNLDRCDSATVFQSLQSIKTFLNPSNHKYIKNNNVHFLIPVDESGIKSFLKTSAQEANEFLRKIFNVTIRLKSFSNYELYNYAKQLNDIYKLGFPDSVIDLICKEYTSNPRKIIQFLNNFKTELLLVEKQENAKYFPKDIVSKDILFLTKLSILNEEFPDLYKKVTGDYDLLEKINTAITNNKYIKALNTDIVKYIADDTLPLLSEGEYWYLKRTYGIRNKNIEFFIKNRDVFKDMPDNINQLIYNKDWDSVKKILGTTNFDFNKLIDKCKVLYDEVVKRDSYSTTGTAILYLIFNILRVDEYDIKLKESYNKRDCYFINNLIDDNRFINIIKDYFYEDILFASKWFYENEYAQLAKKITKYINDKSFTDTEEPTYTQFVTSFLQHFQENAGMLERIKETFSKNIQQIFNNINAFDYFIIKPEISVNLLNDFAIEAIISNLNPISESPDTQFRIDILISLNNINKLRSNQVDILIDKIQSALSTQDFIIKSRWLEIAGKFLKNVSENNLDTIFTIINANQAFLLKSYQRGLIEEVNIECYIKHIDFCFLYIKRNEQRKEILQKFINDFFIPNISMKIIIHINNNFYNEVDSNGIENLYFLSVLMDKLQSAIEISAKREIIKTITKILLLSDSEKGYNKEEIKQIINYSFVILLSEQADKSEFINFINLIKRNPIIKEEIYTRIDLIQDEVSLCQYLSIVSEFNEEVFIRDTPYNFMKFSKKESEFIEKIQYIQNSKMSDSDKYVKDAINKLIDSVDLTNIENTELIFDLAIRNKKLIGKAKLNEFVRKLDFLITNDSEHEKQIYVIKAIDKLDKTDMTKETLRWLIPMLEIRKFEDPEEVKILEGLLKRFS
jgi:hypothetical protein